MIKRNPPYWRKLEKQLAQGDIEKVRQIIGQMSSADTARTFAHLSEESRHKILAMLDPKVSAGLMVSMPIGQASDVIEDLDPRKAAAIVEEIPTDERADILGEMSDTDAQAILDTMPKEISDRTRNLLEFSQDTAGGIMNTEYVAFPSDITVDSVLSDLNKHRTQYADFAVQYVYIVSPEGRLTGVLRLRDLLLSAGNAPISSLMIPGPLSVNAMVHLDALMQIFASNRYIGIPVINNDGKLLGVVSRDNTMKAFSERQTDSYLKSSGIIDGDELRSMPLWGRARRRLSWLSMNIVLNCISASVIAFYQDTLSAVIALAVFLPIISDMSGCSGNQAIAVSIRELTLGIINTHDHFRVLLKEVVIGIINGIVLGVLLGIVAYIWKGQLYLGLVVGGALAVNTLVAVTLGGIIPLLLKRAGKDPALASSPLLTTVTDMCGFFFALSFASGMMSKLIS